MASRHPNRRRRRTPVPGVRFEQPHWHTGAVVAGIDEVGRGAWAGPLTLAAVVLPTDRRIYKLRDSKVLAPEVRQHLSGRLHQAATGVGIGHASNVEVDRYGLSEATRLAAHRAVDALPVEPDVMLIDGTWDFLADLGTCNQTIPKGDGRSASIAAASIVAKVARDRIMVEVASQHPPYVFASNKGYPSPDHIAALEQHGPCELHRRSWAPIAALDQPRLFETG
jgi:ribonuclease HII